MSCLARLSGCQCPQALQHQQPRRPRRLQVAAAASGSGGSGGGGSSKTPASTDDATTPNPGLGLKAVWVGAEALGNVIGATKGGSSGTGSGGTGGSKRGSSSGGGTATMSRQQAIEAIKADYEANYFVSGVGSMEAYAPDCLFADPFASFKGTQRFKNNVSNLGGLLSDIQLDITQFEEGPGPQELTTRWRFSAILGLPWRPRLAAAGGTTHVFDPATGLVVQHIERWDVEPGRVVASLLKPSATVPATFAEVFMKSLSSGDLLGCWFCVSSPVWKAALPLSVGLLVLHAARGEGLGAWEAAAYLAVVAGLGSEMYKVVRSITGGESG